MKNTLNLIKYNNYIKRNNNIASIVFGIIALIVIGSLSCINIAGFSLIVVVIPLVGVALLINFIDSIVYFAKSFNKENARWEFLFPIKGVEYLLAKYIEFVIFQFGFTTIVVLIIFASNGLVLEVENVALICYAIAFAMTSGYIVVTSVISIVSSYAHKVALRLIISIIGIILFSAIADFFENIVNWIFPYLYVNINGTITIGIFETIISIALTIGLVIVAVKHIDSSLEIK